MWWQQGNYTSGKNRNLIIRLGIGMMTFSVSAIVYISYVETRQSILENLKHSALVEVQEGVAQIDEWLFAQKTVVEAIANTPTFQTMDWSVVRSYLESEVERLGDFYHSTMVYPDGSYYATNAGKVNANVGDRPHIQQGMAGEVVVSNPVISRLHGFPVVIIVAPVWSNSSAREKTIGVHAGVIAIDRVSEVVSSLEYGTGSYAFALNSKGIPIVHPDQSLMGTLEKPAPSFLEAKDSDLQHIAAQMVDNQRNIELVQLNGDRVYIAYVPLRHANWSIALVIPRQNIESHLKPLNIMVTVIAALACAMIAVLWRVQSFEQNQLKKSKEAADAANTAKSEFLANMSHELRTPLNAILGFTQLMLHDSSLRREDRENLGIISRAAEHLLSLINDVLDMSKIEAGRMTLNPHNFDLYRLLDTIKEIFDLKADSKGLEFIFERTADVPQYVQTDEKKLRQVLINLLSNAFKFTEEGGVYVSLTKKQSSRHVHLDTRDNNELISDNCLLITVRDTGLGIAPHEIDRLFEAFVQTETGRKSHKGTGLGLPISRQFVQLMGGELTVSSKLGEGTIFQFEIEVKQVEETEIESQQPTRKIIALAPDQPTYRILIVDDRWTNRQLLLKILVPLGFEVREAENGQEAIEIWHNWEPHLIWMDMRMPIMDGYEATKQIKSHLKGQATVIIALTASTFEEERAVVLSAGCDDFVRKPFQDEKIFAKMSEFLGIRYVYEDSDHSGLSESETTIEKLTPESLRVMPTEWIVELNQAATKLNEYSILTLIEQIPAEYASVAKGLMDLVNHVRFDVIVSLSEEAMALS